MNIINNLPAALYLCVAFFISSCTENKQQFLSDREILTGNKWQLEQVLIEQPPGTDPVDFTAATFQPCQMDDLISFREDGLFSNDDNLQKCSPPFTSMFTKQSGGTWSLTGSDLLLENGFFNQHFVISQIGPAQMELDQTVSNYLGDLEKYRFIFKAMK